MQKTGFTLIELIIVVTIVLILVSIAVPTYIDTLERTRGKEAIATLQSMYAAERSYSAERRIFISLPANSTALWQTVGMDNPNLTADAAFSYVLTTTSAQATAYWATAIRKSGPYQGSFIRMDQAGSIYYGSWPF